MIIIGNKKLKETNKNFRALIIKLHKIIVEKDNEIKELKHENLYNTFNDIIGRLNDDEIEILGNSLIEYARNDKEM